MLSFIVPGEPLSKGRPRSGRGRTYTPEQTRNAAEVIKVYARRARGREAADRHPYDLRITFYVAARRGRDGDNMEKLVMDALQGIVWVNDSQVVRCAWAIVQDRDNPRTAITAERITE